MNKLKFASLLTALTLSATAFSSCKKTEKNGESKSADSASSIYFEEITTAPLTAESFPDSPIKVPEINQQEISTVYQAEECAHYGLEIKNERVGFSGDGYITGFDGDVKSFTFFADAPSTQHYDLGFSIASDMEASCTIKVNNAVLGSFKSDSSGKFTLIKMYGIFLSQGTSSVEILVDYGNIDLDYLQLTNNTTLGNVDYSAENVVSSTGAGKNATQILDFLKSNYGRSVVSGQYASDSTNKELDFVYQTTGKYPVIRFSVLDSSYTDDYNDYEEIEAIAQWYRNGGIAGVIWQWKAPSSMPSIYTEETDFRLSKAVTNLDIATLSQEEIRGLFGEGKISEECYGLILDIDNISNMLMSLKNIGVPVLWRPLQEAGGDWYWWGADGASDYKWLYELMYKRMTNYFNLDNLIWIWNGQSADYLVDESMFDIASVDAYLSENSNFGSRYEQFFAIQKMVGKNKLIALSECSRIPDIDNTFRDNSIWSFFGLWYGSYLMNDDGYFSEKYITKDEFIRNYNSEGVLTLDEYQKISPIYQN